MKKQILLLFLIGFLTTNVWGQIDTITYGKKYSGQVPFQGKVTAVFEGKKDATIRFGYSVSSYVKSTIVTTPAGDTILTLSSSSGGVKEFKLPESGTYRINMVSTSIDDFGLYRAFSFVIYQLDPPVSNPDTITYGKKYSGQVPFQGKVTAVFEGKKDATIRFGYSVSSYVKSTIVTTPAGDTILTLSSSSGGVKEFKLPESGTYKMNMVSTSTDDFGLYRAFSFVIYQLDPPVSNPDTIMYGKKYSGQVPFQGKVTAVFEGKKDATIRFGYSVSNYVKSTIVTTPAGDTILTLSSSSGGVKEFKLPESGTYRINMVSTSTDDFGLYRAFSFVIYQLDPPVSNPDTITYGKKYSGQVPFQGKVTAVFEGKKDATIRFGYSVSSYVKSTIVTTPAGDTILTLSSSSGGVKEFKLPESGTYRMNMVSTSTDDFGLYRAFSLMIYQMTPPVNNPDTIKYDNKYSKQVPYLGKVYAVFKGDKDATIRLGYSIERYIDSVYITTPSDGKFLKLSKSSGGVNEIKLPETGNYQVAISSSSTDDYGYYRAYSLMIYQMFPSVNSRVLNFKDNISSNITLFAEPKVYQFTGAKNDLVYINNFTSASSVQMVLYDNFYQPIDTLVSNKNATLDKTLIREGTYYLVCTSPTNSTTTFSYLFNLYPKYKIISYSTNKVGNYGKNNIIFEGNGFSNSTKISLSKEGQDTIKADTLAFNRFKCSALFNFNQKAKGKWDIIVNFGDTTVVLKEGLEIEEYRIPEIIVELIGPKYVRPNRYTYYTIHYKNTGNTNVYEVPIPVTATGDNSPKFDLQWEYYQPEGFTDEIPDAISTITNPETGKITTMTVPTIPIIPPSGEGYLTFGVNMNKPMDIRVSSGEPMFYEDPNGNIVANQDFYDCISGIKNIGKEKLEAWGLDIAEELIPGYGCYKSAYDFGSELGTSMAQSNGNMALPVVGNLAWNLTKTVTDCATDFVPVTKAGKVAWGMIMAAKKIEEIKGEVDGIISDVNLANTCLKALNGGRNNFIGANLVTSIDPNDKIGYRSPSGSRYYNDDVTNFTYIINFENKSTATAPAQEVFITDTLDMNSFDINSFRAGYIKIGSKMVQAPVNVHVNSWQIDMRPTMNMITNVELTLDKEKGIAHWHFKCIDPKTNDLPADALSGFLPPNDSLGSGEGSVVFTINLNEGLNDASNIKNRASIVFDYNAPILTPIWDNTKDIVAPTSYMNQPTIVSDSIATLSWAGEDNKNGSGLYTYNVFVKKSNEVYNTLLANTTQYSIDFKFKKGIEYSFYVTATDSAGNAEIKTKVPDISLLQAAGINDISSSQKVGMKVFPNPSTIDKGVQVILDMKNEFAGNKALVISSVYGSTVKIIPFIDKELEVKGLNNGMYIFTLQIDNRNVISQKVIITQW